MVVLFIFIGFYTPLAKDPSFCFVSRSICKMFVRLYVISLGLGWEVLVRTVLIYLKDKIYFEALWLFLKFGYQFCLVVIDGLRINFYFWKSLFCQYTCDFLPIYDILVMLPLAQGVGQGLTYNILRSAVPGLAPTDTCLIRGQIESLLQISAGWASITNLYKSKIFLDGFSLLNTYM